MYARRLTKQELINAGITLVTEDGHVYAGEHEVIPNRDKRTGYLLHSIYDLDADGQRIKIYKKNSAFGYVYKQRSIGLHRLMWAWFHEEVPQGMVIDHINNKHYDIKDYHLSNLNCTTPRENIRKERTLSTRELPCSMKKPRSYYEHKLEEYLNRYEQAKLNGDAETAHKLRSYISQQHSKLRYWDAHKEEHEEYTIMNIAKTEAKAKKTIKAERIKTLRKYAAEAKSRGDKWRWHNLVRVANNYDAFPEEKIVAIIEKEEERYAN